MWYNWYMTTPSEDRIIELARHIAPTRWRVYDALRELETASEYIAPSDALDLLTRASKSTAIHTMNISGDNPTNFSTGSGHNTHYQNTLGENPIEQIARLLDPEEWNIYDRLDAWGRKTGNITPEWILSLLTARSMDRATSYYSLAVAINTSR